jgi:hypothetical protein
MRPFIIRLRLVRLGVIGIVASLVAGHLVVTVALRSSVDVFNLNEEGTLGTWFSSAALAVVALGCAVLARADDDRHRRGWHVTAAVFALASLDEVAQLHDRVGKLVGNGDGPFYFGWVIPGAVAAVVLVGALVNFGRRLARPLAVRLALGSALFLFGAVGMEMVGGRELASGLDDRTFVEIETSRRYLLTTGVEETFELVGEGLLVLTVLGEVARLLGSTPRRDDPSDAVVLPIGELLSSPRSPSPGR